MRIFLDCTHTAKHTYKNTGIHRVVRELKTELVNISSNYSDIEIVPVMFDGKFMQKVTTLNDNISIENTNKSLYNHFDKILNNRYKTFLRKVKNKLIQKIQPILTIDNLSYFNKSSSKINSIKFEGSLILPGDIYIIADANWDLPKTYYKFLENLKNQGVIITVICYDLIPMRFPEFCSKNFAKDFTTFYQDYSVLFDKVLCISESSAQDYKDAQSKAIFSTNPHVVIKSFRLGCDYSKSGDNHNLLSQDLNQEFVELLNKKYILVVGSLVPHKNIKAIMEAFDLLVNTNSEDIYLLFAGNKNWHLQTDSLIESHRMYGKRIHILGSVSDSQLNHLYANCYCLVQASFYEGFGLPVVEALQNCKPVIASTGGSLPEVGGDFCIYFDPMQPVELYEALKKLFDSDTYYNQLVERIKNEYKPFSWKECAEQFLAHLHN